jgi:hypothetical protein
VLLRGYAEWEPQPHLRELLRQVEEVFDLYSAHRPLAARQVFYRLVAAYDYDKTERAYEQLLYLLARARRAHAIRFEWLRDDSVRGDHNGRVWASDR